MERLASGAWGLREVKSSTRLKDHYIDDIALQAHVLKGLGIELCSIELLHVNTGYMRGAAGISWSEFFTRLNVVGLVAGRLRDLPSQIPAMRDCLAMADLPQAE